MKLWIIFYEMHRYLETANLYGKEKNWSPINL